MREYKFEVSSNFAETVWKVLLWWKRREASIDGYDGAVLASIKGRWDKANKEEGFSDIILNQDQIVILKEYTRLMQKEIDDDTENNEQHEQLEQLYDHLEKEYIKKS